MPATVINGLFGDNFIQWQSTPVAQPSTGFAVIANPQQFTATLSALSLSGTFSGDYTIPGGQTGAILNPGQSCIVQVTFTPGALGLRSALLTAQFNGPGGIPLSFVTVSLLGTGAATALGQPFPSQLVFPTTKIGQTTTFANAQIVNTFNNSITVSNIALATGTSFFLLGAPVTPLVLAQGASSALFSIQFTPIGAGSVLDTLNITVGGNVAATTLQGTGSTLQSAFNLTGQLQGMLFALPNAGAPLVLIANPTNLNCEEAAQLTKLHDLGMVNVEKKWMRVRGHYEDLGTANVTFQLRSRRVGQSDETIGVAIPIGTAFADGWIREFTSEPVAVTGELVQVIINRSALQGPVSLIDYEPVFEPMGEVLGGT